MQITLLKLDLNAPQLVLNGRATGFSCEFQSAIGGGKAIFIPAKDKGFIVEMPRQAEVALGGEELYALKAIQIIESEQFKLSPLPTPGDFTASGKIASVVWLEDAGEYSVIEVLLGDSIFLVSPEMIGDLELEYGQPVSFRIHHLLLWEQSEAL